MSPVPLGNDLTPDLVNGKRDVSCGRPRDQTTRLSDALTSQILRHVGGSQLRYISPR